MKQKLTLLLASIFLIASAVAQTTEKRLQLLNNSIARAFSSTTLERERDGKIARLTSPERDEFETQAMFQKRLEEGKRQAETIRSEYAQRIADARATFNRRIDELKRERETMLTQSRQPVRSGVAVGTYDADRQRFGISVTRPNENHTVEVPISMARDFKNQAGALEAVGETQMTANGGWEYFNWQISFQGQTFRFGPTKGTATILAAGGAQGLPPSLAFTAKFIEPSGNNRLDAEESAVIEAIFTNTGRGSAVGVELAVGGTLPSGVSTPPTAYLGEVPAGQSRKVTVPLRASDIVPDAQAVVTLTPKEQYGFAPAPTRVTFETRALLPPELYVVDFGIDDNNKDGRIESGEMVTFKVRVGNKGRGEARNARATVSAGEHLFFAGFSNQQFDLGTLPSGQFRDIEFTVYSNNLAQSFPVFVVVSEQRAKFSMPRYQLPVEFNKKVQSIQEITVAGRAEAAGPAPIEAGLSVDVDINIPVSKTKSPDAIAIILGVEKYRKVPPVTYARRDAAIFKEYAVKVLGVPDNRNNIYYLTDDEVTKGEFEKLFARDGWLAKRVKKTTDVFVFYAGHGSPDLTEKSAYLIPSDGDPNYSKATGFSLKQMYEQLASLDIRSATVFLDACFSGSTRENTLLLADSRPVALQIDNPVLLSDKLTVLSASQGNQISGAYPDKKHGLFSYFLLKGLRGDADANGDKQLTAKELGDYVREQVNRTAGLLDREQTPELSGRNLDRVLVRY